MILNQNSYTQLMNGLLGKANFICHHMVVLVFWGNAFGDYSYSYDVDLKNKSVSFYKK